MGETWSFSVPGVGYLCISVSVITALGLVRGNRARGLPAENQPDINTTGEIVFLSHSPISVNAGLKATPSPFRLLCFDRQHLTMVFIFYPLGPKRGAHESTAKGTWCHLMSYEVGHRAANTP